MCNVLKKRSSFFIRVIKQAEKYDYKIKLDMKNTEDNTDV